MRRIVRCSRCSTAAWLLPCGFTSVPRLVCTESGRPVEPDDGCTFGAPGDPGKATDAPDVCISEAAAVMGDYGC